MARDRVPFVSVIVPVYNNAGQIGNCVKSLLSLNYPSSKVEIIVVDNNSTDDTYRVIQTFPVISLIENRIQSSYAARNAGLRRSGGAIIAFTDSDCLADKDWILKAVECFQDENIGCVAGRIEGLSPSNYIEEYLVRTRCLSQGSTRFLPYAQTANALYRREVFDSIGMFEETWISSGDADLTWRMLLHSGYRMGRCNDALVYHAHRSTLNMFVKQRMTWGYGEVLMYKKYKKHYQNREGELFRDYREFYRLVIRRLPSLVYDKVVAKNEDAYQENKLTMIAMVGRRIGRIKGSFLEKEFYI